MSCILVIAGERKTEATGSDQHSNRGLDFQYLLVNGLHGVPVVLSQLG